jgi:DNA-binding transcriptional LysR family regulator
MAQQVYISLSILPFDHPDATAETVVQFDLMCFLPARHPLAGKVTVGVERLRNESFISLERDDCSLMTIDRAFQMQGVQKRNQIKVPMSATACNFVPKGIGVFILPPFVGMGFPLDQLTRRRLLPKTSMDIWLLTSSRRPLSLPAQQLVKFLREALVKFQQ